MPAYRSPSEGEVRDAVIARLRQQRPGARIIHEINSSFGGNRIDVLAVDQAEIIAVEIKSAKDKIDRLPAQIAAMRGIGHYVIAALHEKFLVPAGWAGGRVEAPPEAKGSTVWAYPEAGSDAGRTYDCAAWGSLRATAGKGLPAEAIRILWRDELLALCSAYSVSVGKRANTSEMARALKWHCTGRDLTLGICAKLRARRCIEADPEIVEHA